MEKEIFDLLIISKEDYKNYFNSKKVIDKLEYENYLLKKIDTEIREKNFNAIFNATPKKSCKKRSEKI